MLDISEEELLSKFQLGISNVASVSLEIGYCTLASVLHSIINGYKNVLAVEADIAINSPQADAVSATFLAFCF